MIKMIAAVSQNGVIGQDNKLPFECPEDMKFFRKMTAGATVIMGRKTFESIGRPLPKRRNIVVTRGQTPITLPNGTIFIESTIDLATSVEGAITMAQGKPEEHSAMESEGGPVLKPVVTDTWLIGGSSVYREGLAIADEIYLTLVPQMVTGESLVYFPWIDPSKFIVADYIDLENSEIKVAHYVRF